MYKHILVAIDGSELALHAAEDGLALAKALGAKVTAITVTIPWNTIIAGEVATAVPPGNYDHHIQANAEMVLKQVTAAAKARGVACAALQTSDAHPWRAILAAATEHDCDLIVVGSHGRSGLSRLLVGSEAIKLLTHSKLPVLIHRE